MSKEETSEERYRKVEICEQEKDNLERVFDLFINEQKLLMKVPGKTKKTGKTEKGDAKEADEEMKEDKSGINPQAKESVAKEEIDWFDSLAVRGILGKLGVKEIREHDIDIMIWVFRAANEGSR